MSAPRPAELLAGYRPEYFVSGDEHAFPYTFGQSWSERLGEARLLVPAQLLTAPFPNCAILDAESGHNSWHTASETRIPKDGLYDDLVLKVAKE